MKTRMVEDLQPEGEGARPLSPSTKVNVRYRHINNDSDRWFIGTSEEWPWFKDYHGIVDYEIISPGEF